MLEERRTRTNTCFSLTQSSLIFIVFCSEFQIHGNNMLACHNGTLWSRRTKSQILMQMLPSQIDFFHMFTMFLPFILLISCMTVSLHQMSGIIIIPWITLRVLKSTVTRWVGRIRGMMLLFKMMQNSFLCESSTSTLKLSEWRHGWWLDYPEILRTFRNSQIYEMGVSSSSCLVCVVLTFC